MSKIFKVTLTIISLVTILFIVFNETTTEVKLLLIMSMFIAIVLTWLEHEPRRLGDDK